MVCLTGFEPAAFWVGVRHSIHWATGTYTTINSRLDIIARTSPKIKPHGPENQKYCFDPSDFTELQQKYIDILGKFLYNIFPFSK